jgi:hypothetical protein
MEFDGRLCTYTVYTIDDVVIYELFGLIYTNSMNSMGVLGVLVRERGKSL